MPYFVEGFGDVSGNNECVWFCVGTLSEVGNCFVKGGKCCVYTSVVGVTVLYWVLDVVESEVILEL